MATQKRLSLDPIVGLGARLGMLHARSGITDGDSGICRIKWKTDARDSPNLTVERA